MRPLTDFSHWMPEREWAETVEDSWVRAHRYRHRPIADLSRDRLRDGFAAPWTRIMGGGTTRVAVLGVDDVQGPSRESWDPEIDWYEFSIEQLHRLTRSVPADHVFDLARFLPPPRQYDVVVLGRDLASVYPGLVALAVRALKASGTLYSVEPVIHPELTRADGSDLVHTYRRRHIHLLIAAPALVTGGADRALIDLVQSLSAERFHIILATTEPSENEWIPRILPHVREFWDLGSMAEDGMVRLALFHEILARKAPDLLYIMHSRVGFDSLPWVKAHLGTRTVAQFHLEEPGGGWIGYGLSRYGNLIDHNIVITELLKRRLTERYYVEPGRISVIYLGVAKADTMIEPPPSDGRLHVLFPARLDPQKAPWRLLAIGEKLLARQAPVTIHVVGDGPLADDLRQGIARRALQSVVVWEGPAPPERMAEWYQNTQAVLLTSDYEGLPLAILEGMGHGRPIVAPDVGAIREVVDSAVGFLIPTPDATDAYVEALIALAREPRVRHRLGHTAYSRIADRFNPANTAAQYRQAFERLLGLSNQPSVDVVSTHRP